jgi:fructokinase
LIFGEVRFDRFPDGEETLGGAPFNVAWHLRGFGLDPLFVSRVGADQRGDRIRAEMTRWGMDLAGLQIDPEHATGVVEVHVDGENVRFDIVDERAYDFVEWASALATTGVSVLYHGTLALRHDVSRQTLERLLQAGAETVFVDVNLRQPWWDAPSVRRRLEGADVAKLNEDELKRLVEGDDDLSSRAQRTVTGFGLRQLCVTQGKKGATLFTPEEPPLAVEPRSGLDVVDPVGAGDAFSSVLLLGGVLAWDLKLTLTRAQQFAGEIVGIRGAVPRDRGFYRPLRAAWSLA